MKPLEWTVGLTDEQQYAVMMQGPRQLVVASAGSGKTATLVARAIHAVRSGRLQARQVLVLAFNRAAAHELDARLQARLRETGKRDGPPIRASTLHAFALSFVQRAHGTRYRVVDDILPLALQQFPEHCAVFSDYWLFFRVFDGVEIRHPDDFPSWRAWRRFVGEQAACLDGQRGFLTCAANWSTRISNRRWPTGFISTTWITATPGMAGGRQGWPPFSPGAVGRCPETRSLS